MSKTFGPATVLREVDFDVRPGEVHALAGQNGSGKSTLVRLLSGLFPADPGGVIEVNGRRLSNPVRTAELREHGLSFVHQDLGLIGEQSVAENIRVGEFRAHGLVRRIDWRAERQAAARTLDTLCARIDPGARVSTLLAGERATVAIARALQRHAAGSGCIVFDESTQSLPREVLSEFHDTVRRIAGGGTSILIVSHRLDEILALADRVTVLQDGRVVAGGIEVGQLDETSLTRLVLGREIELTGLSGRGAPRERKSRPAPNGLRASEVRGGRLRGLNLSLAGGEIVGVTGATGSGHDDVPYALAGALPGSTGKVTMHGGELDLANAKPSAFIRAGVALIPGQRAREGLAPELSALENLTLPRVGRRRQRVLLRRRWQRAEFAEAVSTLGIVPARARLPVASFSGGNQQKLLLAKWLLGRPRTLLAHEPTQAVDVGARVDILRSLRRSADAGMAVLVSSIEGQDLSFVCDRVLVFRDGRVVVELVGSDVNPDAIAAATYQTPASDRRAS